VSLANLGDIERGLAELALARREALDARAWEDVTRADANEASLLASDARHGDALEVLLRGIEHARAHGLGRGTGTCIGPSICEALWMLGRWDECDAWLKDVEATGPEGVDAWVATQLRAELSLARGDAAAAHEYRAQLERMLGARFDARWELVVTHLDVQFALWQDDLPAALRAAERFTRWTYDGTVCPDSHPSADLMLNAMAAAARHATAERDRRQPVDDLRPLAASFAATFEDWKAGARWGLARPGDLDLIGRQVQAELAIVEDRGDAHEWADIADDWTGRDMLPRAAYARWRAAEAFVAAGDRVVAASAARDAYDVACAMGWQWVRDGVAGLARRARLDLRVDGDRAAPGDDAAARHGLTSREADVLRLVAAGQTNRQIAQALFISTKTASAHVSNVLAKLHVANRGEAAAAARRLGLD
jgi:DNA-binding CsgD family transcriptional regulator